MHRLLPTGDKPMEVFVINPQRYGSVQVLNCTSLPQLTHGCVGDNPRYLEYYKIIDAQASPNW